MVTDDLDGTELADGQGTTVVFSVGTTHYEIDLSTKNADKFSKALKPYTDAARIVHAGAKQPRKAARATAPTDSAAVRAWAADNGIEVSARGRIPGPVLDQYHAAGI